MRAPRADTSLVGFDGVPLFAVAAPRGAVGGGSDFIVVSHPQEGRNKNLLMCFTDRADAGEFLREAKSRGLGRAFVGATDLGAVLRWHLLDRPEEYRQTAFRLIPSPRQVARAQQLLGGGAVEGVPVFQAEGLSLRSSAPGSGGGEDRGGGATGLQFPLFLDAGDLEAAVTRARASGAPRKPSDHLTETFWAGVAERAREAREGGAGIGGAAEETAREETVARTAARALEGVKAREMSLERGKPKDEPYPRIEVGSLEDVLRRMREDALGEAPEETGGEWGRVVLVPGGAHQGGSGSSDSE